MSENCAEKENLTTIEGGEEGDILSIPPDDFFDYNDPTEQEKIICDFEIKKIIGEGTFGVVKLAKNKQTGEDVAIKIMQKKKILLLEGKKNIEREINVLKNLRHPNIVHLYSVIQTNENIFLIMEYVEGKELFDYIVLKEKLPEEEACIYFQQIISGIEYLHKMNVTHRDIKPENLLINEKTKELKIVDFGLSCNFNNQLLSTACGSPSYAPPEMLEGKKYKAISVDIWSSGIVLYAMVCGYLPFEDDDNEELYKKICKGDFEIPNFVSEKCKKLIKEILVTNPKKRLTLEQIKKSAWFNLYNNQRGKIKMYSGLNLYEYIIPIDEKIVNIIYTKFNIPKEKIREDILLNKHNDITTLYYLFLKKNVSEGIRSVANLKSDLFEKYIKNKDNKLESYNKEMNKILAERKNYNDYYNNMKPNSARHRKVKSNFTSLSKKKTVENYVDKKADSAKKIYKSPTDKTKKYNTIDGVNKIIESYENKDSKNPTIKTNKTNSPTKNNVGNLNTIKKDLYLNDTYSSNKKRKLYSLRIPYSQEKHKNINNNTNRNKFLISNNNNRYNIHNNNINININNNIYNNTRTIYKNIDLLTGNKDKKIFKNTHNKTKINNYTHFKSKSTVPDDYLKSKNSNLSITNSKTAKNTVSTTPIKALFPNSNRELFSSLNIKRKRYRRMIEKRYTYDRNNLTFRYRTHLYTRSYLSKTSHIDKENIRDTIEKSISKNKNRIRLMSYKTNRACTENFTPRNIKQFASFSWNKSRKKNLSSSKHISMDKNKDLNVMESVSENAENDISEPFDLNTIFFKDRKTLKDELLNLFDKYKTKVKNNNNYKILIETKKDDAPLEIKIEKLSSLSGKNKFLYDNDTLKLNMNNIISRGISLLKVKKTNGIYNCDYLKSVNKLLIKLK